MRKSAIGAVMLGLGRALGETMAVTFVIGNSHGFPTGLFDGGSTIASTIANEFAEATSDMHTSALLALGFRAVPDHLRGAGHRAHLAGPEGPRLMAASRPTAAQRQRPAAPGPQARQRRCSSPPAPCARGLALIFLVAILVSLVVKGIGGVNLSGLHHEHAGPGLPGGLANAIVGSLMLCACAMVIAVVVGVLAGTWLAEYAAESPYGKLVRFTNDVLLSAPSILIGLFIYQLAVRPLHGFSGFAGALALALLAAPRGHPHHRGRAEAVSPASLRESGIALGAPLWTTIRRSCGGRRAGGIITGALLAFARISGETAPLLFTSLNNQFFSWDMTKPMANLPTVIFNYALSAYDDWQRLAWVGALLITLAVLGANIVVRALSAEKKRS